MRDAVMEGLQPGQERLAPAGRIGARRFVLVLGRWLDPAGPQAMSGRCGSGTSKTSSCILRARLCDHALLSTAPPPSPRKLQGFADSTCERPRRGTPRPPSRRRVRSRANPGRFPGCAYCGLVRPASAAMSCNAQHRRVWELGAEAHAADESRRVRRRRRRARGGTRPGKGPTRLGITSKPGRRPQS